MTATAQKLDARSALLSKLEAEALPLNQTIALLRVEVMQLRSIYYIESNGITRSNTEITSEPGCHWHAHLDKFIEWLALQPDPKPWSDWNGLIYKTSDLLTGRMPETPARVRDLK